MADDLKGPLYLTVITRRGIAQDLKLIPKSKKVEPILLYFDQPSARDKDIDQSFAQESLEPMIRSFIQGIVPGDFCPVQADEESRGNPKTPLKATLDKAYQSLWHRILVFDVKNESPDKIGLDNRVFWELGDLASAFDKSLLDVNESAKLYVIQKR